MFLADLAEAERNVDEAFLLDHLHPTILDLYGREECVNFLASLEVPDITIEPLWIREPDDWTMTVDNVSTVIRDAITVAIAESIDGRTNERLMHVAEIDGKFFFFADCGEPLDEPTGDALNGG